jgi:cyclopropane fatty-acyl-phospholipid synthase-like methyltransferase
VTTGKYDRQAERWSDTAYADAATYLAHRGQLVLSLGPPLAQDDTVLDLACGDGGLADHLPGVRYSGVDVNE